MREERASPGHYFPSAAIAMAKVRDGGGTVVAKRRRRASTGPAPGRTNLRPEKCTSPRRSRSAFAVPFTGPARAHDPNHPTSAAMELLGGDCARAWANAGGVEHPRSSARFAAPCVEPTLRRREDGRPPSRRMPCGSPILGCPTPSARRRSPTPRASSASALRLLDALPRQGVYWKGKDRAASSSSPSEYLLRPARGGGRSGDVGLPAGTAYGSITSSLLPSSRRDEGSDPAPGG